MNNNLILAITIIMLSSITSCKTNKTSDQLLTNCWKHSYEEDQEGLKIYRPCDYKTFPMSRYRAEFTILENGEVTYFILSPTDRHYHEKGNWTYSSKTKHLEIKNRSGEVKINLEIVELSKDKMVIKQRKS